jgi:hypothetical protein
MKLSAENVGLVSVHNVRKFKIMNDLFMLTHP